MTSTFAWTRAYTPTTRTVRTSVTLWNSALAVSIHAVFGAVNDVDGMDDVDGLTVWTVSTEWSVCTMWTMDGVDDVDNCAGMAAGEL